MSILSSFKGLRTLVTNGLVFVTALAVSLGILDMPITAVEAGVIADNTEAVLYAAENIQNVEAISAGVVAAVALMNIVLRLFTTTPAGKKT